MKTLTIALILFSQPLFAQNNFTPTSQINIEFTQDFGNIIAKDTIHFSEGGNFNVASQGINFSVSLLNKAGYYFEPYLYSAFKEAGFEVKNLNTNKTETVDSGESRVIYTHKNSIGSTMYFGGGFKLMKRVSKFLAVGGGIQLNYRKTDFSDIADMEFQNIYNNEYVTVAKFSDVEFSNSKKVSALLSFPIQIRAYFPVGKHYVTLHGCLQLATRAYFTTGIGFSF